MACGYCLPLYFTPHGALPQRPAPRHAFTKQRKATEPDQRALPNSATTTRIAASCAALSRAKGSGEPLR